MFNMRTESTLLEHSPVGDSRANGSARCGMSSGAKGQWEVDHAVDVLSK